MQAFLLAGGRSRRMGRDKVQAKISGKPLVVHLLDKLAALGLDAVICGDRPDLRRFAPILADPVLPGNASGTGPLAGILAALESTSARLNLVLAVDMPALPVEFLRWMIDRAERTEASMTVPFVAGRAQPLCAIYRRELAGGIRKRLEAGERQVFPSLRDAAGSDRLIDVFDVESIVAAGAIDPVPEGLPHEWFRNLNTPPDFALYLFSHLSNKLKGESAD